MQMRCVAVLSLLTAVGTAQSVGSEAPEITWDETFQFGDAPAKKLSELRGSVVLLEFWGSH